MLEFFANNKKLQLPKDVSVNMTWENPFLLQDRIPTPYSLSFDLPGTTNNYAAFGNPQRMNSAAVWKEIVSNVLFNSVGFMKGKLNLMEAKKKLKVNFQGDQLPSTLRAKMNNIEMGYKSFGSGSRFTPNFTSDWSRLYIDTIFQQATSQDKYAVCPIRIKDEEWPYPDHPTTFGNYAAITMYCNFFNVRDGDYIMKGTGTNMHTPIFPQPYIHYILDTVFGDALGANPFRTDSELRTLVMATSFHKLFMFHLMIAYHGFLLDNTHDIQPNYFWLNSFMNAYPFNEFLKNLLKIFCFSLMPRADGKWDIIHNKEILESTDVEDWSNKLVDTPTMCFEPGQSYAYGYSDHGDSKEDSGGLEVNDINHLLSAGEGTYRIKATGEVYEKKLKTKDNEEDPDDYEYELKSSGLGGNTEGDDSYSMVSSVAPMPMGIAEYWAENNLPPGPKSKWYVPFLPEDRLKNDFAPFIGFNRGWLKVPEHALYLNPSNHQNHYPFLSPFDKDPTGSTIANYSLAWEGTNGLIEKFHKEFKAYIEKDKMVLKGYFRLTELDLKNMNYQKKKYIRGKQFFLRKVEGTLKKRQISLVKCELIEA